MPLLDLDALPAAVQAYAAMRAEQDITWQLHRGPLHTGPQSAWVDAETAVAVGRLTIWDDARVHLEVGHVDDVATGAEHTAHDQLQAPYELQTWVARLAAWVSR